jgi:hypothetical protein
MNPAWVLSDVQRKKRFKKYRDRGTVQDGELSPASSQVSPLQREVKYCRRQSQTYSLKISSEGFRGSVCREHPLPMQAVFFHCCCLGMFIPDPNFSVPDPGSGIEKIHDPDPQQRI